MKKVARFIPLMIMILLVAALSVSPVLADPGGQGKGKGNPGGKGNGGANEQSAELWAEPSNPYPAYGTDFVIRGSGFDPNSTVHVSAATPGCCLAFNVGANGNGEIGFMWTTGAPGTYVFRAFQGKKGKGWETYAETSVVVE